MSTHNHIPCTVAASLDARLAPFHLGDSRSALEDLDVEASRAVAPQERNLRLSLVNDLKLLFAALGAGGQRRAARRQPPHGAPAGRIRCRPARTLRAGGHMAITNSTGRVTGASPALD